MIDLLFSKLIPCDDDNLSDPYVRVLLLPDKSTKKKTQIQKNTLDPVFDETYVSLSKIFHLLV